MKTMASPQHRPFFTRPNFLQSPPKPFDLPIYVEPIAQALASQSISDYIPRPKALNSDALVYFDQSAEESDCEGSRSEHSTTSSSRSESSKTTNSYDDAEFS